MKLNNRNMRFILEAAEEIEKAAITIDNPTPSKIKSENIWGPSYVYGIITDERIHSF